MIFANGSDHASEISSTTLSSNELLLLTLISVGTLLIITFSALGLSRQQTRFDKLPDSKKDKQ